MKKENFINPHYNDQLFLYGYKKYFDSFVKLYSKKKLPNTILISGPKGIGKSTFINHFVNYILSTNQKNKYDLEKLIINKENQSFKLSLNNIHPNLFCVDATFNDKDIKIDEIRNLLNFLNKSSDFNNLKIVIINNLERLNKNSANALLKALEDTNQNTYFFLVFDNKYRLLDTIKSRSSEFKIYFSKGEKEKIFSKLLKQYNIDLFDNRLLDFLYHESPGNLLNYILSLDDKYSNIFPLNIDFIYSFIKKYEDKKDKNLFNTLIFLINNFYHKNCLSNFANLNKYLLNYKNINNHIYNLKKYNLSEKNTLKSITEILYNEAK